MNREISALLENFAATPGQDYVLAEVAEDAVLPKIARLSHFDIYMAYLTIIAFPNRSIKHGKILVRRLLDLKGLSDEYLQQELSEHWSKLPEWVREVFLQAGHGPTKSS
jgi:hypothetical protein